MPLSNRPQASKRCFTSPAVEAVIARISAEIDPPLGALFTTCFPNTLDTTIHAGELGGEPDTFVITGDIPAMWLRDSTAQVWPYLPLCKEDDALKRMVAGVIRRQAWCVGIDPFANAFNHGPDGEGHTTDKTQMAPEVFERKWEIDSLANVLRLAHGYWIATGDVSPFDARFFAGAAAIVATFTDQQRIKDAGSYRFARTTANPIDTVPFGGLGNPTQSCGLIHSAFRPSDDGCLLPFLVPANAFAVVALRGLADLIDGVAQATHAKLGSQAARLADSVEEALIRNGTVEHPRAGRIWAYEVDGFGNSYCMDDANVPSLLSLPYLGFCKREDPLYQATRGFVLSRNNPWYFRGKKISGVGSPHTGRNRVWPIALCIQALTSDDEEEIRSCLRQLATTHAKTGFMHEAIDMDRPERYSRPWFAWANTLFGELVLTLYGRDPDLLRNV
jgi:meiotically up-regulated gene 157 (Mug157) protein